MSKVHLLDHPLIQHKVTIMRDKNTKPMEFRNLLKEISMLMAYEITRDMPLIDKEVETPIAKGTFKTLENRSIAICPVLRAGLGMVDGLLAIYPNAKVGHIGMYRDPETLQPVDYYCKLPVDIEERMAIICEPMLATGVSANHAIEILKKAGCKNIKLMDLVGETEGVELIQKNHPDVDIFICAIDKELNEHAYIVPGLGDCGDRLFGTK